MIKRFMSSRSGVLSAVVMRLTPLEKIILLLITLLICGLVTDQIRTYDIFWQLQSGKYMVENLTWIYTDIFSLAADAPRWEHCWLHDVIFYGVWLLGGYSAISLLKGVLLTATFLVIVAVARLRGSSLQSILFLSVPAFLCTNLGWLTRPQLWSFFCFALFLLIFEKNRQREFAATPWLLFLVSLCWANLHAGAVLAIPLMGAWLIGSMIDRKWLKQPFAADGLRSRQIWMSVVLVLAGLSLTPYGPQMLEVLFIAPTLGADSGVLAQSANNDWRVTTVAGNIFFFYALGVTAVLLLAGRKKFSFHDVFLLAGTAFMGMQLVRHTPFFFFACAALLPSYLDVAVRPLVSRIAQRGKAFLSLLLIVGAFVWIAMFANPLYAARGFFNLGLAGERFPVAATEFIGENKLPGNLFNSYVWGGYLMWRLFPDYLVFYDGRQDSLEFFNWGYDIETGSGQWQQLLARHDVNTLIVTPLDSSGDSFGLIGQLKNADNWELVYADDVALVFLRKGVAAAESTARHVLPKSRIDTTIFAQARAILKKNHGAYEARWERASILLARKEYQRAFVELDEYLRHAPANKRRKDAVNVHKMLSPLYGHLREE